MEDGDSLPRRSSREKRTLVRYEDEDFTDGTIGGFVAVREALYDRSLPFDVLVSEINKYIAECGPITYRENRGMHDLACLVSFKPCIKSDVRNSLYGILPQMPEYGPGRAPTLVFWIGNRKFWPGIMSCIELYAFVRERVSSHVTVIKHLQRH